MRSKIYDRLEWAQSSGYLQAFIETCSFDEKDCVLDIGTGTGIVAKAISRLISQVHGIDISPDMLEVASRKASGNIIWEKMDARELVFPSDHFDKVTARMVFHHILEDREKALKECWRVLKPGGRLILSEGVPPDKKCRCRYDEIFRLKEERVSFLPEEIESLLTVCGFRNIRLRPFWMRRVSTREWLVHSGVKPELTEKILKMHIDSDDHFKKAYNMEVTEDDVIVDWKFVIATAEK